MTLWKQLSLNGTADICVESCFSLQKSNASACSIDSLTICHLHTGEAGLLQCLTGGQEWSLGWRFARWRSVMRMIDISSLYLTKQTFGHSRTRACEAFLKMSGPVS